MAYPDCACVGVNCEPECPRARRTWNSVNMPPWNWSNTRIPMVTTTLHHDQPGPVVLVLVPTAVRALEALGFQVIPPRGR